MNETGFSQLIEQLRTGDNDAVQKLIDDYGEAIRREVRFTLLDRRVRRVVSESDVCQSVITRLCIGMWAGRFEFDEPKQLVALLKDMVRKRVADHARYWRSQRRDIRRNISFETETGRIDPGTDKTPSAIVSDRELLEKLKNQLSDRELQILSMRQDRVSWAEIAKSLDGNSSAEAVRKQYERALAAAIDSLGVDY